MGGNAFPNINIVRIKREDIYPTVNIIVDKLEYPGFTFDYAISALMGSAGKQETSGDLDFALNNTPYTIIGQVERPVFNIHDFYKRCVKVIPLSHISSKTIKSGQIQTAWPINGQDHNGFVQCDFIVGDFDWLQFSHYSPGADKSPWKGVFISTLLGVLAKQHVDYLVVDETKLDSKGQPEIIYKVGLYYDIEKGLHRQWKLKRTPEQKISSVDPEMFETRNPLAPRFARIGYIKNPSQVLKMLFNYPVSLDQVDTFEKLRDQIKIHFSNSYDKIAKMAIDSLLRSAAKKEYTLEQLTYAFYQN
jgi:hypothetical protein